MLVRFGCGKRAVQVWVEVKFGVRLCGSRILVWLNISAGGNNIWVGLGWAGLGWEVYVWQNRRKVSVGPSGGEVLVFERGI